MRAHVKEISKITAKGQTTVPISVRKALRLGSGDRIAFVVNENGVSVQRADEEEADPAITSFLAFVAGDMQHRPEAIRLLSPEMRDRIAGLVNGVGHEPDEPIEGDVSI